MVNIVRKHYVGLFKVGSSERCTYTGKRERTQRHHAGMQYLNFVQKQI